MKKEGKKVIFSVGWGPGLSERAETLPLWSWTSSGACGPDCIEVAMEKWEKWEACSQVFVKLNYFIWGALLYFKHSASLMLKTHHSPPGSTISFSQKPVMISSTYLNSSFNSRSTWYLSYLMILKSPIFYKMLILDFLVYTWVKEKVMGWPRVWEF